MKKKKIIKLINNNRGIFVCNQIDHVVKILLLLLLLPSINYMVLFFSQVEN